MITEHYEKSDRYKKLAEELISDKDDLKWLALNKVRIDYVASTKKKSKGERVTYGECKIIKDVYKMYIPYDFVIIVYEMNTILMTDEQIKMLLHHELLHIGIAEKNGELVYRTIPHDVEDFRAIIDEYGIDWAR